MVHGFPLSQGGLDSARGCYFSCILNELLGVLAGDAAQQVNDVVVLAVAQSLHL
jgi:hypothetical protein